LQITEDQCRHRAFAFLFLPTPAGLDRLFQTHIIALITFFWECECQFSPAATPLTTFQEIPQKQTALESRVTAIPATWLQMAAPSSKIAREFPV